MSYTCPTHLVEEKRFKETQMDIDKQKEQTLLLEKKYAENRYNGSIEQSSPFTVLTGPVNILLSAPHSVNHFRQQRSKKADVYTGALAELLHESTGCISIMSSRFSMEDPNFITGGTYKKALSALCRDHSVSLIIDIHGASESHSFDIDLGTIHGRSIRKEDVSRIRSIFTSNGIEDVRENNTFSASHAGTITHYAMSELQIPAIQIEINRRFRKPEEDIGSFMRLLTSLEEIIHYYAKGPHDEAN